jgi:hypothetical protein
VFSRRGPSGIACGAFAVSKSGRLRPASQRRLIYKAIIFAIEAADTRGRFPSRDRRTEVQERVENEPQLNVFLFAPCAI